MKYFTVTFQVYTHKEEKWTDKSVTAEVLKAMDNLNIDIDYEDLEVDFDRQDDD